MFILQSIYKLIIVTMPQVLVIDTNRSMIIRDISGYPFRWVIGCLTLYLLIKMHFYLFESLYIKRVLLIHFDLYLKTDLSLVYLILNNNTVQKC